MNSTNDAHAELTSQLRLLDAIDCGLLATDSNGKIVGWNKAAELHSGVPCSAAMGESVFNYLNVSPLIQSTLAEQIHSGGHWQGKCHFVDPSGDAGAAEALAGSVDQVPIHLTLLPITGQRGTLLGSLFTFRSIATDDVISNRLNQWFRLQRLATSGQLSAYLTHEINQPLSAICNFSGGLIMSLTRKPLTLSEVAGILERINSEALRAGSVVNRLRGLSAPILMEQVSTDANGVLDATLTVLKNFLSAERTIVRIQLSPELPPVKADSVRLEQVLINLIKNSVEAMQSLPTHERFINVATRLHAGQVQISIKDCGPAITPEAFSKLTQPFYTTKPDGLGMGLWVSRAIVAQHGGHLDLQRVAPQGLESLIRLPALRPIQS
jgi:signal transduction histidine kinase